VELVWSSGEMKWLYRWGTAFSSAMHAVAGRLVFPAPSSALDRCRPGPRGLPGSIALAGSSVASHARELGDGTPHDLSPLLQSAHRSSGNSSQLPKKSRASPLLGFALFPPLCRSTFSASTPGSRGFLRPDGTTRRVSFRPRGFSPPRRLSPRWGCGFVAPHCRLWSSTRFLLVASLRTRRWLGWSSHSPRRGSHPSKSSPHQQPYRITAAVALLPLLHVLLARTCPT
jgi:hypothetical protein